MMSADLKGSNIKLHQRLLRSSCSDLQLLDAEKKTGAHLWLWLPLTLKEHCLRVAFLMKREINLYTDRLLNVIEIISPLNSK